MNGKLDTSKWAALLGLVVMLAGCEADPVSSTVFITPDSVTIRNGQAITFTATGGFDYQWSLSNESYGALSTRRGPTTTYVSMIDPGANTNSAATLSQVLRVTSSVSGSTTTNTGQVTTGTAEAYITHM